MLYRWWEFIEARLLPRGDRRLSCNTIQVRKLALHPGRIELNRTILFARHHRRRLCTSWGPYRHLRLALQLNAATSLLALRIILPCLFSVRRPFAYEMHCCGYNLCTPTMDCRKINLYPLVARLL